MSKKDIFPFEENLKIAVVIPCFRVTVHILDVIASMRSYVTHIYVIDDKCPDNSGQFVLENTQDIRVKVLFHEENQGVGGAVLTGYKQALKDGVDVIVKIDGDGQMDPELIPFFVTPILEGKADYTKGNRFFYLESLDKMPKLRLFGNAALSFISKVSSGYWNSFDPTNGYTAIRASLVNYLPSAKISKRYFFETDVLFRLNIIRAVVMDIPMDAKYEDEVSHLKISKVLPEFALKNTLNFFKRIFYNYYLREMSVASFELPLGILLFLFGVVFGILHWGQSLTSGHFSSSGTVMLSALPILAGLQLILAFISQDIHSVPKNVIFRHINFNLKHIKDQ